MGRGIMKTGRVTAEPTNPVKTRQEVEGVLSLEQLNAVDLLVLGKPDQAVAEAVGVTRQTVCGWRNDNPTFAAVLNERRAALWGAYHDRLRTMVARALDVLEGALDGEDEKQRWAAARLILSTAGNLAPGKEPIDPDKIEVAWLNSRTVTALERITNALVSPY